MPNKVGRPPTMRRCGHCGEEMSSSVFRRHDCQASRSRRERPLGVQRPWGADEDEVISTLSIDAAEQVLNRTLEAIVVRRSLLKISNSAWRDDLCGVFGSLVVIKRDGKTKHGHSLYQCLCRKCGSIRRYVGCKLRSGHTTSCGCWIGRPKKEEA